MFIDPSEIERFGSRSLKYRVLGNVAVGIAVILMTPIIAFVILDLVGMGDVVDRVIEAVGSFYASV